MKDIPMSVQITIRSNVRYFFVYFEIRKKFLFGDGRFRIISLGVFYSTLKVVYCSLNIPVFLVFCSTLHMWSVRKILHSKSQLINNHYLAIYLCRKPYHFRELHRKYSFIDCCKSCTRYTVFDTKMERSIHLSLFHLLTFCFIQVLYTSIIIRTVMFQQWTSKIKLALAIFFMIGQCVCI